MSIKPTPFESWAEAFKQDTAKAFARVDRRNEIVLQKCDNVIKLVVDNSMLDVDHAEYIGTEIARLKLHPQFITYYDEYDQVDWSGFPIQPSPEVIKPKCDCGAKSTGVKDYMVGHAAWCKVSHEKTPIR